MKELVLLATLLAAAGLSCTARGQGDPTQQPNVATEGAKAHAPARDYVMSKADEKALLASVDEVMGFVAADTGLPPVAKVKRRLVTREEVTRYLVKNFDEDESARRLQRSEIVLKKFGLLDRDFQLRPFLLTLLTEQIAGYYDDRTKVVNLLNWVEPEQQKPVLAHELTHALQDGKVGLEKWSSTGFKGVSKTASEDQERVAVDEVETARQAVAEGQAMVTFIDYSLKGTGKNVGNSPEAVSAIANASGDAGGSPVMARAPLLLQRSLTFPYVDGLVFEAALLTRGGKNTAFAAALDDPPSTSWQVMNPEAYLTHTPVPQVSLPDVHPLLDGEFEPYDVGVMGELDVEMMASLFGGPEIAKALAPAWRGGVYYAGQKRVATAAERLTTGSLGVLYFSRWANADAAGAMEKLYAGELGRKYDRMAERRADEAQGESVFTTGEGDVLLWTAEDQLFISEGIPLPTARKLRDAAVSAQSAGPMKMAAGRELGLGTLAAVQRLGMLRAAMGR